MELFPLNLAGSFWITALGGVPGEVYVDISWPEMERIQQLARIVPKEKGQRPLNAVSSQVSLFFAAEGR